MASIGKDTTAGMVAEGLETMVAMLRQRPLPGVQVAEPRYTFGQARRKLVNTLLTLDHEGLVARLDQLEPGATPAASRMALAWQVARVLLPGTGVQ